MVSPLRGRYLEDSRADADQRVALGLWALQEMSLAGQPATVYWGAADGGADAPVDSIRVFLSDATVFIGVWAPVDPDVVLGALLKLE